MRFAALGDLHGSIAPEDVSWLDGQGLDAVLICGDLGGFRPGSETAVAQVLSRLRTPAIAIPGNHDAVTLPQLGAEVTGQRALADRLASGMVARVQALQRDLGAVTLGGYSVHDVGPVRIVVGRPHTFGGPGLGCRGYLAEAFGVSSLEQSADRLTALLTQGPPKPVVVLGHTGPTGLGDRRDAPCGRDFHRDEGDWGDPDLAVALDRAALAGAQVRAVVFGHMHHHLSGGGQRRTFGLRHGVACVNAARVPRVDREGWRHHVEVEVTARETVVCAVKRRGGVVLRSELVRTASWAPAVSG